MVRCEVSDAFGAKSICRQESDWVLILGTSTPRHSSDEDLLISNTRRGIDWNRAFVDVGHSPLSLIGTYIVRLNLGDWWQFHERPASPPCDV